MRHVLTATQYHNFLGPQVVVEDPGESFTLRTPWTHYKHYLAQRFSDAEMMLTTHEDVFTREEWAGFLTSRGYQKTEAAVFCKTVPRLRREEDSSSQVTSIPCHAFLPRPLRALAATGSAGAGFTPFLR